MNIDIAKLEKLVNEMEGIPDFREFEAMQAIVNTWVLRSSAFPGEIDLTELYNWYIQRLIKLYAKLLPSATGTPGHHYYATQEDPRNLLAKINVILSSLPDAVWPASAKST